MSKVRQRTWKQRSLVSKDPPPIILFQYVGFSEFIDCDFIFVLPSDNPLD